MKKTKQILIGYLTVLALLLTTSCEKELYEDAINQNSDKQLAIKKISFTEFRKNSKAFLAFKNATSEAASNDNLARGVYNAEFEAVIDTSNIVLIEKNNTKSITIKIIDEDPTKDENIVLLTTNQNDYTAYKTEYILSQQEILTLNQGQNITNKTPNSVTNLETQTRSISNSCFDFNVYTVLMCRDRNGNEIYTQGDSGDDCVGISFDVDYFILSVNANCLSSSGGFSWNPVNGTGNNNNNSNNNGANDNNGGVSSGNDYGGGGFSGTGGLPNNNNPLNTDSEFLTTPLLSSSTSIGRLLNFLTENQANFFFHGLDGEAQISILNYIDENTDENGFVNSQAKEFVKELIDFYNDENIIGEEDLKNKIKQAIANGITSTAEFTHKIFKKFSDLAEQYPSSKSYINSVLETINDAAATITDTNPQTCTFADLFNMWLFELGPNPININGSNATSTNQLKVQEGVNQARNLALAQIQNGTFNNVSNQWQYGQAEFYDGIANGNFVTAFLGTYTTSVTITQNSNGYQLNFHVLNTSSWESATRFRIDNDNNGAHDGIFPNTYRNNDNDLSMGGNFTQHWYWSEPVN